MKSEELIKNEINQIADNLIEISFQSKKYASWYNIHIRSNNLTNHYCLEDSGLDLSGGLLGDMIFYYTLYYKFKNPKYLFFAEKIYNYYIKKIENNILLMDKIGLLHGYGGIIYTFTLLYSISKDLKFLDFTEKIIDEIDLNDLILNTKNLSIVEGCAGLLISLCKFHKYSKNTTEIENLINTCTERLLNESILNNNQMFWKPNFHDSPLCGLAHGSSGYALAFHYAYDVLKNPKYLNYIRKILFFENSFYCSSSLNWIDDRKFVKESHKYKTFAWSHGSPGIGLVRNKLLKSGFYEGDLIEVFNNDVSNSIKGILNYGLKNTKDILIYGIFGNLDLLINTSYNFEIEKKVSKIINDRNRNGWNYGYQFVHFYKPGFMQGLSGIGYQLLRVLDKNIKSVLIFD
ncbi:lanthionine synthetase LanC family protein [Tenacibaculum finnmarkense]|uniref:lanthionine synthetase LanC family protein n=1 Tax=Tenacibaculum finnmarkense TaxID=2781243 RepID=UPI001E29D8D4|nr:lanthionine synthetase LanC family protein [Tenacibaculum finnmarkense]MCD8412517.1 hypothetical protein [Tenacibaculum finnmarkense genomovar ulcerans]MCG8207466.1 hypothetical protein [Tenacibaculum finnmarkense genomovar finnmarkense]MCG8723577.1 hypothetical protein [Tenacibaculum finnmarkense]MCG8741495.1 hypothetical protein [Tenacibaculum finnmarkense]MCG8765223.1 hypothetical protein [Tenacibaculum finnmarkense]